MKKSFRIFATLLILAVFVTYFLVNSGKFKPLLNVSVLLLFIIAAGDVLGIFFNGLFTMFILQPFKKQIPVIESFYISLISTVGNFFAPVGAGFGFRAVYLKRKFGLPYGEYISTLSGNYIIVFLVNSFFGLLSLYLLRARRDSEYNILVLIFAAVFIVSLVLSLVKIPVKAAETEHNSYLRRFLHQLVRTTEGWNHIISHKKLMLQLIMLTSINFLLTVGITFTIIKSLHFSITTGPLLLFSVLGSLSLFINITPANLGVKEAIYLFSSKVLGFSTAQILSIALIDRGVMFLLLALLWLISHKLRGTKNVQKTELSPQQS